MTGRQPAARRLARVHTLMVADLKALSRDLWTTLSLVLMALTLGALPHLAPLLSLDGDANHTEKPAASWACAPGQVGAIATAGAVPDWLTWPDPILPSEEAQVLVRFGSPDSTGQAPQIEVIALTQNAPTKHVERCLRARLHREQRRRLDALGITEGPTTVVELRSALVDDPNAPAAHTDKAPVPLGAALATAIFMLMVSLYLELAPRSRASGWVEAWLSLPGHHSDLVWAWWLIGVLVGTIGVGLTLLGHTLASHFSALPTQPLPWITVPVLVLLASALGLRSFLDVEDMRTAITRSIPVIFGIAVLTGIALAAEQHYPGLGGLVPVAGLGLAMAGQTTSTGIALAIASSLLSTSALLASSIHTLRALPGSMGAMSRAAARRAAGNYFPEVILLTLVALAGSSVWGPAALTGQDLAIATFISMLAFVAAPALAISSPLDLERRALLSWRRPPARVWLLLPLIVAGTLGLANLLWYAAVAVLPQNDMIEAYSQTLTGFDSPLGMVAVSLLPGICEELLFRGAILGLLRRGMATTLAVIVQALLFAALHGLAVRFPYTFGLGLVLGLLVIRTRSLWPAIVVHTLHNLLSAEFGDSMPGPESPWLWVAALGITAIFFTGSAARTLSRRHNPDGV